MKIAFIFLGLVALATCRRGDDASTAPKFLYDIKLDEKPAFVSAYPNPSKVSSYGTTSWDLGITSFTGNV